MDIFVKYLEFYFQYHIILLVFLFLSVTILATELGVNKKAKINLAIIIGLIFFLTIVHTIERILCDETNDFPDFRFILTVIKYIGPQLILCLFITTILNRKRLQLVLYGFLLIEFILLAISQAAHIIVYITPENSFTRGPLWFIPFVLSLIYLAIFIYGIAYKFKTERFEFIFLLSVAILCAIVTVLEALDIIKEQLNTALGASVLFYEIYLFYVNSKKDFLTGLLNRQSFMREIKNHKDKIAALISMDLNGLKAINDTKGHSAGDDAIIQSAKSFMFIKDCKYKVYRVGGDEFNAIVYDASEAEVKELINKMKNNVINSGYSVSFGYVMNDIRYSVDDFINFADYQMYKNKKEYYNGKEPERNI